MTEQAEEAAAASLEKLVKAATDENPPFEISRLAQIAYSGRLPKILDALGVKKKKPTNLQRKGYLWRNR